MLKMKKNAILNIVQEIPVKRGGFFIVLKVLQICTGSVSFP